MTMEFFGSVAGRLAAVGRELLVQALAVYATLLKVMLPALLVVKALDMAGATGWLAVLLSPSMQLVGLPDAMGLVWATAMLTNLYTAIAVYAGFAAQEPLTVAQATVLGTMMLVSHSLPVEGAVARASGVGWRATLLVRIGGALVLGALLHRVYASSAALQQPARLLGQAPPPDPALTAWALAQLQMLVWILVVIVALMTLLRLLRAVGIERLIHAMLAPLLNLIGIRREAANATVIGITLGLSFGGGLLIREARSGVLTPRDMLLVMSLLGLCHSLIEDTLLMLLLGAHLSGILWARLAFALVVVALIAHWPRRRAAAGAP
jgi:hypothetical protein